MATVCPICEQRRPKRSCPGLASSRWSGGGDRICPQCCGEQRELTIDCPSTCIYLITARRYQAEHPDRQPAAGVAQGGQPAPAVAFADVVLDEDFLAEQQPLMGTVVAAVAAFAQHHSRLTDAELLLAVESLARTHQTLASGLYYEQPLENVRARELYTALQAALERYQHERQKKTGVSVRPGDVLKALVFLVRLGQARSNGRPFSRAYLDFLRAQLPADASARSESPIILPGT